MFSTEYPIDEQAIKHILVVQFRPFGDVLLATSYLEALTKRFPGAAIDFLVKKPFHDLLYKNPWVSRIIAFEQHSGIRYVIDRIKLMRDIRRWRYDLIIDQQSGTGSGQVVLFSKAAYRLGWSDSRWRWCYNLKATRGQIRYRSSQNFDMLRPLGINETPHRLFYHIRPESLAYATDWLKSRRMTREKTIIISPGSPRKEKKWRAGNFSMLADQLLLKTDMQVVLLCGPDEYTDARAVLEQTRQPCHLALSVDFNHAAAFIKHCRLLICNDGGINHLSVAVGVPSLAIFGNTSPARWSPQDFFPYHYHLHNANREKRTGNDFGITPDEAFHKVLAVLAELPSSNRANNSWNFSKT
jgi:ADP-heptose:LPS heptosyltransferase